MPSLNEKTSAIAPSAYEVWETDLHLNFNKLCLHTASRDIAETIAFKTYGLFNSERDIMLVDVDANKAVQFWPTATTKAIHDASR